MGVLATTRAFGDRDLKQFGVTSEPEVISISRSTDDELLILATDGVFNVLSNEEVADVARRIMRRAQERGASRAAAVRMAASAIGRFSRDRNSKDDITVLVVDLTTPSSPGTGLEVMSGAKMVDQLAPPPASPASEVPAAAPLTPSLPSPTPQPPSQELSPQPQLQCLMSAQCLAEQEAAAAAVGLYQPCDAAQLACPAAPLPCAEIRRSGDSAVAAEAAASGAVIEAASPGFAAQAFPADAALPLEQQPCPAVPSDGLGCPATSPTRRAFNVVAQNNAYGTCPPHSACNGGAAAPAVGMPTEAVCALVWAPRQPPARPHGGPPQLQLVPQPGGCCVDDSGACGHTEAGLSWRSCLHLQCTQPPSPLPPPPPPQQQLQPRHLYSAPPSAMSCRWRGTTGGGAPAAAAAAAVGPPQQPAPPRPPLPRHEAAAWPSSSGTAATGTPLRGPPALTSQRIAVTHGAAAAPADWAPAVAAADGCSGGGGAAAASAVAGQPPLPLPAQEVRSLACDSSTAAGSQPAVVGLLAAPQTTPVPPSPSPSPVRAKSSAGIQGAVAVRIRRAILWRWDSAADPTLEVAAGAGTAAGKCAAGPLGGGGRDVGAESLKRSHKAISAPAVARAAPADWAAVGASGFGHEGPVAGRGAAAAAVADLPAEPMAAAASVALAVPAAVSGAVAVGVCTAGMVLPPLAASGLVMGLYRSSSLVL